MTANIQIATTASGYVVTIGRTVVRAATIDDALDCARGQMTRIAHRRALAERCE
jgi:hypothetical protein